MTLNRPGESSGDCDSRQAGRLKPLTVSMPYRRYVPATASDFPGSLAVVATVRYTEATVVPRKRTVWLKLRPQATWTTAADRSRYWWWRSALRAAPPVGNQAHQAWPAAKESESNRRSSRLDRSSSRLAALE